MFSPLETKDGKDSVVDDFMYGSNVASAHVYIRMGKLWIIHIQSRQDGLCHFRASIMGTDCNSRKVQMDTKVWSRQLVCSVIIEAIKYSEYVLYD
jgi:hypothetical protein